MSAVQRLCRRKACAGNSPPSPTTITRPWLTVPPVYPDAAGEFFGYERHGLRSLEGWDRQGTKALVGATLAATTLVAIKAGRGVVRADDAIRAYRNAIGDAWTDWLERLYVCCKYQWAYQIPAGREDRRELRDVCYRALGFEQRYLLACHDYLLAESERPDAERRLAAIQGLQQLRFADS